MPHPMVLVLCLNAAVDKTAQLRRFAPHRRNRLGEVLALAGGKGINVARALRRLGSEPRLLGFTAGFAGRFIEDALKREGLRATWIRLPRGESRTCLSLLDGPQGPTEVNEAGPRVRPFDLRRLEREFKRVLRRARLVILSGSLPPGCPAGTYARLIKLARAAGRTVLLDTSEAALPPAVSAGPHLCKLNGEEAASLGLRTAGRRGRLKALECIRRRGAREAIVTLGPEGAVGYLGGHYLSAVPPRVRAVTPIGCGDTFLAGVAHSLMRGKSPEETLGFATALATASARVLGAGVFRPRDVPGMLRQVRVSRLA